MVVNITGEERVAQKEGRTGGTYLRRTEVDGERRRSWRTTSSAGLSLGRKGPGITVMESLFFSHPNRPVRYILAVAARTQLTQKSWNLRFYCWLSY